jgi:hypothetical protein
MSPVRYELGFYIPEDDIVHSHRRKNLKSYISIDTLHIWSGDYMHTERRTQEWCVC